MTFEKPHRERWAGGSGQVEGHACAPLTVLAGRRVRRLVLRGSGPLVLAAAVVLFSAVEAGVAEAAPPLVETTGAPVRSAATAQLGGRVDPQGAPATYFFEYGAQGSCDSNPCAATAPLPAGSGDLTELVAAEATGLEANTTYHYRLVAANGDPAGPSFGADRTVTTRAGEAPLSHGNFPGPPGSDRAWEQVSPPETGGNPVNNDAADFSIDGSRALSSIAGGTPTSETGFFSTPFLAERTGGGWQQRTVLPPRSALAGPPHWYLIPDADLSAVVAESLNESSGQKQIWRLQPGGPAVNLLDNPVLSLGFDDFGISDHGARIVALLEGDLDPQHPSSGVGLYDLSSGTPRLVSLLPDGTPPPCGVHKEAQFESFLGPQHRISADGSRVFFASACGPGEAVARVYARDFESETTEQVSPPAVSGPECDSVFVSSSPGAAFIWTKSRLTADDTNPNNCSDALDGDVYRYDLGSGALRCLTCVISGVDADVFVPKDSFWLTAENIFVAEDGSRLYFQSPHALVPGAPEVSGGGSVYRLNVGSGDLAWVGGPNLQMRVHSQALTPGGAVMLFAAHAPFLNSLNGTQNAGMEQYYRYDDRDRSLLCVSCPLDGSAPLGEAGNGRPSLSDDGEVIPFATPTPLVSADQNTPGPAGAPKGGSDVYEWRDGRYLLVSDGLTNTPAGAEGPAVSGISADGRDLYFIAEAQYTADALDSYIRLYDARIGGGFEFPKPPPPCPLEVCQGTPKGAPEEVLPGTGTFVGPGNARPRRPCRGKLTRAHHRCKPIKRRGKSGHRRGTAR